MTESEMGEDTIYSPSWLEAAAVVAGRLAEVLGAVAFLELVPALCPFSLGLFH